MLVNTHTHTHTHTCIYPNTHAYTEILLKNTSDSAIPFPLKYISKRTETYIHTKACAWMFTAALFTIATKSGNSPNVLQQETG